MPFPVGSLRVDLGANTVSFQTGMAAAQERLQEFQRAGASVGAGAQAMGRQVAQAGRGFGSVTGQIQNAAFQVGDFAVQVAGGTSATRALAQQLPQLLGGFGVMGAVIGAAVAVIVPMAGRLFETGDAAEAAEKRIDALNDATKAYADAAGLAVAPIDELIKKYGDLAEAVRNAQIVQAELRRADAMRGVNDVLTQIEANIIPSDFSSQDIASQADQRQQVLDRLIAAEAEFRAAVEAGDDARIQALAAEELALKQQLRVLADVREVVAGVSSDYGVTAEQASLLAVAVQSVRESSAGTAQEQVAALETLTQLLQDIYGSADAANEATGGLVDQLSDAVSAIGEIASTDIARPIEAGRVAATGLADELQRAARAQFYASQVTPGNRFESEMWGSDLLPPGAVQGPAVPPGFVPPNRRGGVGGGRSSADRERIEAEREAARVYEETRTTLEGYNAELERLGQLHEQGLIDADTYGRALDQLPEKYEELFQAGEQLRKAQEGIADAFADAIVEGRNFGEAISAVLKDLASQMIRTALIGGGPGGGSGLFGFLFQGLGGLFGGGRANGGPVMGNRAYLVGERGPELFVPPTSGSMMTAPETSRALAGGGGVIVHMSVDARGAVDGVAAQVQRELVRALPEVERRTLSAVRGGAARGKL